MATVEQDGRNRGGFPSEAFMTLPTYKLFSFGTTKGGRSIPMRREYVKEAPADAASSKVGHCTSLEMVIEPTSMESRTQSS